MDINLLIGKIKEYGALCNGAGYCDDADDPKVSGRIASWLKDIEKELNIQEAAEYDAGYFSGYDDGYKDAQAKLGYNPQGVNSVVKQKSLK